MMLASLLFSTAAAVPVTFCVDYTPDFDDSDVPGATEDYFATNSAKPAAGILVQAHAPSSGTTHSVYADIYQVDAGCADFDLPTTETWTIRVLSRMELYDNSIDVRTSGGTQGRWKHVQSTGWTPVAGTYDFTLPATRHWNVLAASSHALIRNQAGLSDFDVDFHTQHTDGMLHLPPSCSGDPCVDGTDIYVDDTTARRKFQLAYLQGWAAHHEMGWSDSDYDDSADDTHCGNGSSGADLVLETLEWPSAGYLEGFAHWYSASAFNNTNESDCSYVYWRPVNWDRLDACFADREALSGHVLSCATGPSLPPYESLVPDTNYRGYCESKAPGLTASSPNPFPFATVVPLDVVRFFHDRVYADSGYSRADVGRTFRDHYLAGAVIPGWRTAFGSTAVSLGADGAAWSAATATHGLDQ